MVPGIFEDASQKYVFPKVFQWFLHAWALRDFIGFTSSRRSFFGFRRREEVSSGSSFEKFHGVPSKEFRYHVLGPGTAACTGSRCADRTGIVCSFYLAVSCGTDLMPCGIGTHVDDCISPKCECQRHRYHGRRGWGWVVVRLEWTLEPEGGGKEKCAE